MAIEDSDFKILISSGFKVAIKSCWNTLKGHPIISVFLFLLVIFYVFLPSFFNLLLYTTPLVIGLAILVRRRSNANPGIEKAKAEDHSPPQDPVAPKKRLRPTIQRAMSRRTFKKRFYEEAGITVAADPKDEKVALVLSPDHKEKGEAEVVDQTSCEISEKNVKTQEDGETKAQRRQDQKGKLVVELTEDEQRLMDLGASEIENHKRLENMIAKRRARRMLSMVPQRTPIESLDNDHPSHATHLTAETSHNEGESQPGSAPSALLLTKSPFDLPYDPSEEKPILTGDGFEDVFRIHHLKDVLCSRHDNSATGVSASDGRPLDLGENLKQISKQSSAESQNLRQSCEQSAQEVQPRNSQSDHHEDHTKLASPQHKENTAPDAETVDRMSLETVNATEEQEIRLKENEEEGENASSTDEPIINPSLSDDGNDTASTTSSLDMTTDDVPTAIRNEAFRNSVKKVLLGLAQRNKSAAEGERNSASNDAGPKSDRPTKMEERSFYTEKSHHPSSSMASDMHVEVSEAESSMLNDGPNSPTDRESFVLDGNEDGDVNSGDEDILGGSRTQEVGDSSNKAPMSVDDRFGDDIQEVLNQPHDSTSAEEQAVSYPSESSGAESENTSKPDAPKQSSSGSVSPVTHEPSINQQVTPDSDTSPTARPHENPPVLGSASTSTVQNIDSFIRSPPNNLPNEDQQSFFRDGGHSEPEVHDMSSFPKDNISINGEQNNNTYASETVSSSTVGSSSSPDSVSPRTAPSDEKVPKGGETMSSNAKQCDRDAGVSQAAPSGDKTAARADN